MEDRSDFRRGEIVPGLRTFLLPNGCADGSSALHYFATVSTSWFFTGFSEALCFSTAAVICAITSG